MNFHLFLRPQAELEILEVAEYYESERVGLGLEFLDELEEAKNKLTEHSQFYFNISPEKAQRQFLLNRFPYTIVYEIKADEVIIIAVRNSKRKPIE